MDIFGQNRTFWEESINARRSVRSYLQKPLDTDTMNALVSFCENVHVPFTHDVELRFFKAEKNRKLANNLAKPPEDCIAFIANTDLLSVAKVGFIGELVLLYATGLGVSTCWFGHYLLSEVERLLPNLTSARGHFGYGYGKEEQSGKMAICISPLGYRDLENPRFVDQLSSRMGMFKRKPLDERLIGGISEENLHADLHFALDLARKAPSAANTQHWEFAVSPDQTHVTIAKPVGFKHIKWEHPDVCVGACAAHFWLGLTIQGIGCEVTMEQADNRILWHFALQGQQDGT